MIVDSAYARYRSDSASTRRVSTIVPLPSSIGAAGRSHDPVVQRDPRRWQRGDGWLRTHRAPENARSAAARRPTAPRRQDRGRRAAAAAAATAGRGISARPRSSRRRPRSPARCGARPRRGRRRFRSARRRRGSGRSEIVEQRRLPRIASARRGRPGASRVSRPARITNIFGCGSRSGRAPAATAQMPVSTASAIASSITPAAGCAAGSAASVPSWSDRRAVHCAWTRLPTCHVAEPLRPEPPRPSPSPGTALGRQHGRDDVVLAIGARVQHDGRLLPGRHSKSVGRSGSRWWANMRAIWCGSTRPVDRSAGMSASAKNATSDVSMLGVAVPPTISHR